MNSYDTLFQRKLAQRIRDVVDEKAKSILAGNLADMAEYKGRTQYIRALNEVLVWFEEVADEISGKTERK